MAVNFDDYRESRFELIRDWVEDRKIILIITAIAVLVTTILVWCYDPPITEGEIIDKKYEPANEYVMFMPVYISNGKSGSTIMIPMYIYDDEDYILHISAYDEKKKKWRATNIYVTPEIYNDVNIGDYYIYSKSNGDSLEDPEIRLYSKSNGDSLEDPEIRRKATTEEKENMQ